MATIPKILKQFNLMIAGQGMAGIVTQLTLPSLNLKTEEHRAGGMDTPVEIDMGMEKMELKFTLAEHLNLVYRAFGTEVQYTFRGAKVGEGGVVEPMIIEARGVCKSLDGTNVKAGDPNPLECTMTVRYIKILINGERVVEVDALNMTRFVNGVDQLAAIRNAISA